MESNKGKIITSSWEVTTGDRIYFVVIEYFFPRHH
jgi:hypothetical protein